MSKEEHEKIEITLSPIKKIVIFECVELPIEEFFKRVGLIATSGQLVALNWSEGILFLVAPYYPDSDIIIEQALKGTFYWSSITFSSMPKYESIKRFGAREVPIIDQTSIPSFRQAAQWLKKRLKSP